MRNQSFHFIIKAIIILTIGIQGLKSTAQTVNVWVTKGDQSSMFSQKSDLPMSTDLSSPTITINEALSYQTIDGFGYALTEGSAEAINTLPAATQTSLLNELFDPVSGIGISALRISIGASDLSNSDYTYDENDNTTVLKKILAINPDIKILATPWTAPLWMKTNNSWSGGSLNTAYYDAYARYFIKYFEAMKAQGINIWAVTPQNEPENANNNPSMTMNSSEEKNFINNNLGPAIKNSAFSSVKIIAFDHNCDYTNYPIDVLNNSTYVDGAAFHLYAGNISALSTVHNATNKNVYFTEQYTAASNGFWGDLAWHTKNVTMGSLNNWSKTVFEWNLASYSNWYPHTQGGCADCKGALTINNNSVTGRNVSYYLIAHFSKSVRPGAKRIGLSGGASQLYNVAFKNVDGSDVLEVFSDGYVGNIKVNTGTKSFTYYIDNGQLVTFKWSAAPPVGGGCGVSNIPGITSNSVYKIVNHTSGKVLSNGGSSINGANIIQETDNAVINKNQQWQLNNVGFSLFNVVNIGNGKALDNGNSTVDGTNIIQQISSSGALNQKWSIINIAGNYYKMVCNSSCKSLDNKGGSSLDGNVMIQYTDGGTTNTNQQWSIVAIQPLVSSASKHLEEANQISVFPNPSQGNISVYSDRLPVEDVSVIDLQGQVVYQNNVTFTGEKSFNIQNLKNGMYFIDIKANGGHVMKKIIIQ
jgi:glucosylceramidase